MKLKKLIFVKPDFKDESVKWEELDNRDWDVICQYRGNHSIYLKMSMEEQFMFLCFVALSEGVDF